MARDSEPKENDDYESVAAMADRLGLKGKERSQYLHDHMTGLGYRMVPSYVREDEDEDSGSGRFGLSRSRRDQGRRSRRSERDEEDSADYF